MRNEYELNKQKYELKITEVEKELKAKNDIIAQRDAEIKSKDEKLVREEKIVDELEKSIEMKCFEYERNMQVQMN
jgi:uncharacterized protein (DUF3084 family)